jgi:hypothetical protein
MKKACFLFIMLTFSLVLSAQDLIVRTNGESIYCKITRIDTSEVYFTIIDNGAEVKTSLAKNEIKSMQFGVDQKKQDNVSTEDNPVQVPSPSVSQSAADMPVIRKNRVEGIFYFGCGLPAWQGDVSTYADALTLSMYNESGINFNFKPGPRILPMDVGLGLGINITSWFTLQAAVELAPKGVTYRGKGSYDDIDYTMKVTHKTNYIEIPVGIMLSTRSWDRPLERYFYIRGGVAPAYNVVAKTRVYIYATDGYDSDSDSDTADMEGVAKQDLCGYAAIGFGRKGGAAIEFKYEKGTEKVMTADYTDMTFYNSSYTFNLVFFF